jgi:nucleoside-diphosphate-sugar epimerase
MSSAPAIANRTALVFGASGITGWAILREALKYPTSSTVHRVIGLTNRPLDRSKSFLPEDNRLVIVSGVDLTAAVDDVVAKLAGIDGIKDVTDVYFAGTAACFFI